VSALVPSELLGLLADDGKSALIAGRFREGGEYAVECLRHDYGQAPQLVSYVIIGSLISVIPLMIAFLSLQRFWRSGLAAGSITL
jgi:hypothetical protein